MDAEFVDSIKAGLINVPEIDEDNRILTGARRIEAMKQAGFEEIEVNQITGLSEAEKLSRAIRENKDRLDPTQERLIAAVGRLHNLERSRLQDEKHQDPHFNGARAIAKMLGYRDEPYVSDLIKISQDEALTKDIAKGASIQECRDKLKERKTQEEKQNKLDEFQTELDEVNSNPQVTTLNPNEWVEWDKSVAVERLRLAGLRQLAEKWKKQALSLNEAQITEFKELEQEFQKLVQAVLL